MRPHSQRRSRLRHLYGFDFPEDLLEFWEFANRVRPLEPLAALAEVMQTYLVGPFEVLAGRFDGRTLRLPLSLHWRYHDDPPEFFTVLKGASDGLHWGYFLDDPAAKESCVASYYTRGTYEIHADGDNLFEAVRLELERHYRDCRESLEDDAADAYENEQAMRQIDDLRTRLPRVSTRERPAISAEYEERYPERSAREARVVAATREGMGIVVPPETYRPLSLNDRALWRRLRKEEAPDDLVSEALAAAREGFPGTALKLGKDLWAFGGERRSQAALDLLDAAYAGLGRSVLREVLQLHQAHRHLPSVDILENEAADDGE